MIKVVCTKNKNTFKTIKVSGHANSAPKGEDLVCAGISTIVFGMANAVKDKGIEVEIKKNTALFNIVDLNKVSELLMQTLYIQILTLKSESENFIEIKYIGE